VPVEPLLLSIQIGAAQWRESAAPGDGRRPAWKSGIWKLPVQGPVGVSSGGMTGDEQADTTHHGGPDKALLAYSAEHYPKWKEESPDSDWQYGGFGENLTIAGLDESSVCIGDVYRIGEVHLEVSQPRQPCWKLCRRWNRPDLAKRVIQLSRSGWYLRVLEPGDLSRGLPLALVERPSGEWTIERASRLMYGLESDTQAAEVLSRLPTLSLAWREDLISRRLV
jgi:MOSC domain-containing protein YiiM